MWPYLLAAGSTLLSMDSKRQAGSAEVSAGQADYADAALSGRLREKGIREKRDRVLGTIRARAGASGVEMAGSALEVLMESAAQAERDLVVSRHVAQRNLEAASARIDAGSVAKRNSTLSGMLKIGGLGFTAGKDFGAGYKSPTLDYNSWPTNRWGNEE